MSHRSASSGPNWGLLLLVPAVVIVAKAAMHRRAMLESGWAPSGAPGRGYGHRHRFGGGEGPDFDQSGFRLPPKIERTLDAWHTRAHKAEAQGSAPDAPDDATQASETFDA
jgi:hypothetical protein